LDVGIHADTVVEIARVEAIHIGKVIEHVRGKARREQKFVDERFALVGPCVLGKGEELFAGGDTTDDVEVDPTDEKVVGKRFVEGVEAVLLQVCGEEGVYPFAST
jgi:methyl coenzyme M reductase subunit C